MRSSRCVLSVLLSLAASRCARSDEGVEQPRAAHALAFETQSVTVGGCAVRAASVVAEGPVSAQQNWFFSARPKARGALRVRVAARGARFVESDRDGLVFAAGEARVRYSHGVWVDREGAAERVPARFVDGAIELSVSEAVLERTSFPAVLDPTVTLLNGSGLIESNLGVDQAYPAVIDERTAVVGVGHYRSLMSNPSSSGYMVDISAAATSTAAWGPAAGQDLFGLAAADTPVRGFIGAYRQAVGASANLYVFGGLPLSPIGSTGFAPADLPELDCARDGRCAATYSRIDAPSGIVVRRFDAVAGAMVPTLGLTGSTYVTDPPLAGQHDVAMLGGRPVSVSAHRDTNLAINVVRVGRLPETQYTGTLSLRLIEFEGERPRVACGPAECAVVFVRGINLFALRFTADSMPSIDTIEQVTLHSFTESPGSFDVSAIAGGYRVAYVRRSSMGMRSVMVISDHLGDFSEANARRTVHALLNGAEFVRLSSAPAARVSLLAWVSGSGVMAAPMGAVIRPDPINADAEASVDASDASDVAVAVDGSDAQTRDSGVEDALVAMDANDASVPSDGSTLDAPAHDAAVVTDTTLRFTGGACACRVGDRGAASASSSRALWGLALAAGLVARRRRRAVSARS